MTIQKITKLESTAVVMPEENLDTDQIIPARFLKTTSREGFGAHLFHDLRYDKKGNPVNNFALNKYPRHSKILVAGKNFGCGSSREHAAWAISDYGFQAVVSSFFADIFRNNALNNGVVPVQVSEKFLTQILEKTIKTTNPATLKIDIMKKEISIINPPERPVTETFPLNNYKQTCLMNGYDDIDYLIASLDEIEQYEQYRVSAY
jgi:3-isopropylmalate/(R)-2-methylmalate dehydratase small subunit